MTVETSPALSINKIIDTSHLNTIYKWLYTFIESFHLSDKPTHIITTIILLILFTAVMLIVDYILKNIFIVLLRNHSKRTKSQLDDILIDNKVLDNITHLIPITLAQIFFPVFFNGFPNFIDFILSLTTIIFIIVVTSLIRSIIKSVKDYVKTIPKLADKPIDSYTQVASIVLYFFSAIIIFSIITGKDPLKFLISLGAASAILMLVFKDTLLGFVASIQVSTNDMVRVGDWIEMTKFGADGTVLEINLSTVKVQNFDKTITTIPTYLLISDSFKNYRGMQASGGRRIKRSINIKMSSIRFLTKEEIHELKKIQLLKPYIEQRQQEIEEYNERTHADQTMPVNGRRITNIGMLRAYVLRYAQQNSNIHKEYPLMVRHLQPTEHGLPLELYMFTNTIIWAEYETIMADIFDHVFASIDFFHLEVYELPSSDDVRQFIANSKN